MLLLSKKDCHQHMSKMQRYQYQHPKNFYIPLEPLVLFELRG